jgi:hypothetical protein
MSTENSNSLECLAEYFTRWDVLPEFVGGWSGCLEICWSGCLEIFWSVSQQKFKLLECLSEDFMCWDVLTDFVGVSC